jgi:Ion channel
MRDLVDKWRLVALLVSIVLLLVAFPYVQGTLAEDVLLNLLQAAIVIAAVSVVSTDWKHTAAAVLLGVLSLLSGWVPRPEEYPPIFFIGGFSGIGFYAYAVLMIARHILDETEVTFDTLCGGCCGYLLLGFLWTEAYDLIEFHHPHSIIWASSPTTRLNWPDLLYFSFATLTTTGYGDVNPVTAQSRSAALLEAVSGVFYIAVMISRLVGLQIANRRTGAGTMQQMGHRR